MYKSISGSPLGEVPPCHTPTPRGLSPLEVYIHKTPLRPLLYMAKIPPPKEFYLYKETAFERFLLHYVAYNRGHCLPKPSASSPLDNRARPMANTSLAPDLEGLHHEIHGMAEQMRMMNKNNTRLIQLITTTNRHLRPHLPFRISSDLIALVARETTIPRTTVLVESEESYVAHQVLLLPDVKGAYLRQNPGHPAKLPERRANKKLPPGTIDSFGDLSRFFVTNFMSYRIWQKNVSHLFTIHQKEAESLKDYVKQFTQAILEVEDTSDKVVIIAIMEGLRPSPLFESLSKNVLETLSALQNKIEIQNRPRKDILVLHLAVQN
ncbi:hypothetical protein Acr_14g0005630 [Actinidia rufa]|uniref:Retrotransposon gag domain-containing protein n=1 Tax=Actinidia rufa TaxID=165716 RepID=A0A7J0FSK9_9ERIC|nr:hypothetical protein Acr_14g0005630 [Actinidia rufa]